MTEDLTFAEMNSISKDKVAIAILGLLTRVGEPLKKTEMEEILSYSYSIIDSVCFRLIRAGLLQETRNLYDTRSKFYEIKDKDAVKQILEYYEKQEKRKSEHQQRTGKLSNVEEV
jgi:DNA-binding MarR family transcriptional regulator